MTLKLFRIKDIASKKYILTTDTIPTQMFFEKKAEAKTFRNSFHSPKEIEEKRYSLEIRRGPDHRFGPT